MALIMAANRLIHLFPNMPVRFPDHGEKPGHNNCWNARGNLFRHQKSTGEFQRRRLSGHRHSACGRRWKESTYRARCYMGRNWQSRPFEEASDEHAHSDLPMPAPHCARRHSPDRIWPRVNFIPCVTGLPSTRVAPRHIVHMPAPSRYEVRLLPSFSFRN